MPTTHYRRQESDMAENVWCTPHDDGFQVKREGAERASSVHPTQEEAWEEAKRLARGERVEAILTGRDGQVRERNSYGNDPANIPG
jgi:hypothetical protein